MQKRLLVGLGLIIVLGGCVKKFRPEKIKKIQKNEPVHYRATKDNLEVAIKVLSPEESYSIFKKDIAHYNVVPLQLQINNMSSDSFVFSQDFITGLNIIPTKKIENMLKQRYGSIVGSSLACIGGGLLLSMAGSVFAPAVFFVSAPGLLLLLSASAVVVGTGFMYYGMLSPLPKACFMHNSNRALSSYLRAHNIQEPLLVKACGQSTVLLFVRDYPKAFQLGFLNNDAEKVVFDVTI